MKQYFLWMDSQAIPHVPQPAQRILAQQYLEQRGGSIVYYSGEELTAVPQQLGLREKLKRSSGINGFVFFSIKQFSYGKNIDFALMKTMLKQGFELHFVREDYAILNLEDLKEKFHRLYLYHHSNELRLFRLLECYQKWESKN